MDEKILTIFRQFINALSPSGPGRCITPNVFRQADEIAGMGRAFPLVESLLEKNPYLYRFSILLSEKENKLGKGYKTKKSKK